jgi:hypothetical protein
VGLSQEGGLQDPISADPPARSARDHRGARARVHFDDLLRAAMVQPTEVTGLLERLREER